DELQGNILRRIETLLENLVEACHRASDRTQKAQKKQHDYHDSKYPIESYEIGELVLLFKSSLAMSHSSKLEEKWTGPYYIHDTYRNSTYKLRTIDRQVYKKPVHGNRLKKYCGWKEFSLFPRKESNMKMNNPEIEIKSLSTCTEAQQIHEKVPLYIEDLRRREISLQSLEIVIGRSWEYQMRQLCAKLNKNLQNPSANLQNFYLLGKKINDTNWGDAVRKLIQEEFPNGYRNFWKTAFCVYTLYSCRGIPNLFNMQHIMPHILLKMYENDFSKLLDEAKTLKSQEEVDLLNLYETFTGAQSTDKISVA
ncbi:15718_t:CDS:2, partial [Cetraspora pellucida]